MLFSLLLMGCLGGVVAGFSVTASLSVLAMLGCWKVAHLHQAGRIKGQISVKSSILIMRIVGAIGGEIFTVKQGEVIFCIRIVRDPACPEKFQFTSRFCLS